MQAQGKKPYTRLRHIMRQMRAAYLDNVKAGRCVRDDASLAIFDTALKGLESAPANRYTKHQVGGNKVTYLPAQRRGPKPAV